ncbi:MAG TPA: RHS repeat-associated core domain-containing protein [Acidobacteriota bacterium]|nr:RHS repeat-associated core domain-containing protein [Acidobacteriota bacterium]
MHFHDDDINCGWYQFTGLSAGTYTLTASKPCCGLNPWSIGVTITSADATEKNFTARTQTYSIYGTVTELGGSPVAGAALSLYKNLLHLQSTVSNSSGQYSFNGLSNGRYTITIDSGCVPVFGNMSAFISCASVERNFECQSGLCESKRQEAAARLNRLKTFDGIDNKGRQADNGDMDATADKDNPSAFSHQPSALASSRTEASVAEYLFYHCDHLGTVRLITTYPTPENPTGVVSRHDYEPFGVEIAPVVETAGNTHRFTGHERDKNTGYDYMHYRSYGSNIGRFMKPDNITGNPLNPQSWNLYSYVRGNPVNFNDPTGHLPEGDTGQTSTDYDPGTGETSTTDDEQEGWWTVVNEIANSSDLATAVDYVMNNDVDLNISADPSEKKKKKKQPETVPYEVEKAAKELKKQQKDTGSEYAMIIAYDSEGKAYPTGAYTSNQTRRADVTRAGLEIQRIQSEHGGIVFTRTYLIHSHPDNGTPNPGKSPWDDNDYKPLKICSRDYVKTNSMIGVVAATKTMYLYYPEPRGNYTKIPYSN